MLLSHTCTYISMYNGRGKNKHSILFYSILNSFFFAGEAGGQGACAGKVCGDPAGLREAQRYQEPASTRQQDQRENARGHTTEEN
jgi:hypothetical protein